ncbi:MAG: YidB family protein [Rubrivivax sp.]
MLGKLKQSPADPGQTDVADGAGGVLGKLGGLLGGGSGGNILSGGLGELIDRFKQSGHGPAADSWVASGPNQSIGQTQLEQAIGPEALETLQQQTGLSRDELLSRLTRDLPAAVDKFTPEGRLPTEAEASKLI